MNLGEAELCYTVSRGPRAGTSILYIRTTIVQVHASPTNIFVLVLVLVLVLDHRVFDYENEANVVAASAASGLLVFIRGCVPSWCP